MRKAPTIELDDKQRMELERLSRSRSTSVRLAERSRIVLLAAEGRNNYEIAARLEITRQKAGRWRNRFVEQGLAGIEDAPRSGRIPTQSPEASPDVTKTLEEKPPNATHRASMAKAVGVSESTVGKIWRVHGLKPHLSRTFKLSNDKRFAEKLEDVVGLYLSPPENAIVLSCDEKSQMQALDRTQPGLPLKKGRCGTMTHDYKRNGTTTLFAALNILDGSVIGTCMPKHRHQEWIRFLNQIKRAMPKDKEIHIICDNYATHKHQKVVNWLKRNKRFHVHFTPTSASWLNMVERFFRDLSEQRLRRGVFRSVPELIQAVEDYLARHNETRNPSSGLSDILAKVQRGRRNLDKLQSV